MSDQAASPPSTNNLAGGTTAGPKGMKDLLVKKSKAVMHEVKFRNMFTSTEQKQNQELDLLRSKLLNPKKDRKENFVVYNICQRMQFFKSLTEVMTNSNIEILLKFLDGATYEKHPAETVLMKEDDYGDKAYVVLRGRVAVLRKQNQQINTAQIASVNLNESNPITKKLAALQILDPKQIAIEIAESQNPDYADLARPLVLFLRKFGTIVGFFQRGQMFGHLALTTTSKRTASAVTLEETEFMVFTRDNFQHIKRFYTEEFLEREELLKSMMPKMENIRDPKKETQLVQSFQPMTCHRVEFLLIVGTRIGKGREERAASVSGEGWCFEDLQDNLYQNPWEERECDQTSATQ